MDNMCKGYINENKFHTNCPYYNIKKIVTIYLYNDRPTWVCSHCKSKYDLLFIKK
jgi:transposase-like protein